MPRVVRVLSVLLSMVLVAGCSAGPAARSGAPGATVGPLSSPIATAGTAASSGRLLAGEAHDALPGGG